MKVRTAVLGPHSESPLEIRKIRTMVQISKQREEPEVQTTKL